MSDLTAAGLCIMFGAAIIAIILLCAGLWVMTSDIEKESWEHNDMGKGCDETEED